MSELFTFFCQTITFSVTLHAIFLTVTAVQKLIILCDNCSFQTLVFLVEYHQNATSLQDHIQIAFNMLVGLHPPARLTITTISIRSPNIGVQIIDVSDSRSFTLAVLKVYWVLILFSASPNTAIYI